MTALPDPVDRLIAQWREQAARHKQHGDCYRVGQGWGMEQCADELSQELADALAQGRPPDEPNKVTRFEVINESGRVYSRRPCSVELSYQDAGRTLKVFLGPNGAEGRPQDAPPEALVREESE